MQNVNFKKNSDVLYCPGIHGIHILKNSSLVSFLQRWDSRVFINYSVFYQMINDLFQRISFYFLFFTFFSITLAQHDPALYNHPELDWSTFETEHFVVHFHQGTRRTADLVGKIAEDIYRPLTDLYQYEPSLRHSSLLRLCQVASNGYEYQPWH